MAELDGVAASPDELEALALTNYGHFTSMRIEPFGVRGLSLHLDRLETDCRCMFDAELDRDRVRHLIRRVIAGISPPIVVRVTVFDSALGLGHPGADARPRILLTTRPAAYMPLPGLKLQSATYSRDMPRVKHVGLCGSLWRRREAQRNGFEDALFVGDDGAISEAATSNIGFIDGDRIVWPAADCLPGVTMRLIDQARNRRDATAPMTLGQLGDIDAVFVTNAAVGVRSVSMIDGTHWPDEHATLHILRKQYADIPLERI